MYLPPPHLATASRPSYAQAYTDILTTHRRSPLTSAASLVMLVAPDVDALCAARILAELFKQDDVMHRIVPVSGSEELKEVGKELLEYPELHTMILINMGGVRDLFDDEVFGLVPDNVAIHVIDSARPLDLSNALSTGTDSAKIIVWDDGHLEELAEERKAWEVLTYEPEIESDEEDSDEEAMEDSEEDEIEENGDVDEDSMGGPSNKRRLQSEGGQPKGKRRKTEDGEHPPRTSRDERDALSDRLARYYTVGSSYGQSASGTIYILATVLERVDNDMLCARISRALYDKYHSIYYDEVHRLNPSEPGSNPNAINPDDLSVRATDELRFMLFRHWTLYDAMYHSSYVAGKLGIWKEKGRKRLTGLLAKMGFSIPQTQQPYAHMDIDLKTSLRSKLDAIAPEYGLLELSYASFIRCFGYRSQPLSAADAVEGISALLDVAGGIRVEIEVEGARNGGEWFGGGKVWEADSHRSARPTHDDAAVVDDHRRDEATAENSQEKEEEAWWRKNFWTAFDALGDIVPLRDALPLAMSLHRAVIRQGTSIIDKQDIKTMRSHRVVILTQGPDLALFAHPGVLSRLALWLVDALRDRMPGTSISNRRGGKTRKSLPFVVACLDEKHNAYLVVGVMAALDFDDVQKNQFGLAFMDAKARCHAETLHGSFDTSVIQVKQEDLKTFLETLCEDQDGY
ncbi:hypothetical protein HWV62_44921 [Athelia sp. TMB]|nr:hypothetical protein HWV62_44921 [Athelia sp. TMB]